MADKAALSGVDGAVLRHDNNGTNPGWYVVGLRAYDGTTEGWGQNIVFRNPPSDWDAGDNALASTLFTATAPAGWNANYRWVPFIGPVVQWVTDDPHDASTIYVDPTTRDLFFSFSADLMLDTDMDGIGDTELSSGDDVRLYVGTAFVFANWAATGIDFSKVTQGPQYDSVVRASASVPSTPVTALLLAMACGALGLVKRFTETFTD